MEKVLIQILQLLFSLSILVILHELGHYIPAKLFKTRVEKFYLFFDPWFSLFKVKHKDTEYGIGWLPLGGYVKIAGMIDESLDKEQMKSPPKPWEFRSKPAWQRLIIMLGGVTVNLLLAILIYIFTLSIWGEAYLPNSEVKYGIAADSLAQEMGLRNGDKILSVDGKYVEDFFKIPAEIILQEAKTIQVLRDGAETEVVIPGGFISKLIKHNSADFIFVRVPFVISDFSKQSPAKDAGFQINDSIIGVNGISLQYFDEFKKLISSSAGQTVDISLMRGTDSLMIPVTVSESGVVGVVPKINEYFNFNHRHYNVAQAIPGGFVKAYSKLQNYLLQLKLVFSPETKAYQNLGGFITIGSIFPGVWDWRAFWELTAFLSIILAIMNLLPIPALDGGHVLFLIYEIVTGRKPSNKFLEYAQIAGMVILFSLLFYANGNDIVKLFR